jgi:hypoxanthine phosphoribosyltransferase
MSGIPTWDKITSPLASTTTEFGGNWANLISDYYNGTNIALLDANKAPLIGTTTRYKFEKLSLLDVDASHSLVLSVDDIDTGPTRKIRIRRMNNPYEEDFAVLESMAQSLLNKIINADLNTITNIENADIKAAAAIATTKLADSANFILKTLDNDFGAHYLDVQRMTAPGNPSANYGRIFIQQEDSNNDTAYMLIKKNGSFQKVFIA